MNKTYLDKVIDKLVDETVIVDGKYISTTFYQSLFRIAFLAPFPPSSHTSHSLYVVFKSYVKRIYGLTNEESKYVWKQYKERIITSL